MKEQIGLMALLGIAIGSSALLPFNDRQRRAIRERDDHRCQFPECPISPQCNPRRLECHHIKPQGYLKRFGVDPDFPENALTICERAHDAIHPDRVAAKERYRRGDKKAFQELHPERQRKLEEKKPYWQEKWDRAMGTIALKRTQQAKKNGWEFPEKGGEKNGKKK